MRKIKVSIFLMIFCCFTFMSVNSMAKSKIDLVFIIDRSGSMGSHISNVRYQIRNFTDKLEEEGIDYRLGLLAYEDYSQVFSLTDNVNVFKSNLSRITVEGGTEDGLDAIMEALNTYIFCDDAIKYFVLIGDEGITSDRGYSNQSVINELNNNDIILTSVGVRDNISQFSSLSSATNGLYLDLSSDFGSNLQQIFKQIQTLAKIDIVNPTNNQLVSDVNGLLIPTVSVSDDDCDRLTISFYIDNKFRESVVVTNTQTAQNITFNGIDLNGFNEGIHELKFIANDGSDCVEKISNIKIDNSAPIIDTFNVQADVGQLNLYCSATDLSGGLMQTPYQYSIGEFETSWIKDNTYCSRNLLPNTQYDVQAKVRDIAGHVSTKKQTIYTRAQTPTIEFKGSTEDSISFLLKDCNPLSTEYRVKVGSDYLSQTGRLTSSSNWITFPSKNITIDRLKNNVNYQISIEVRNFNEIEENSSTIQLTTKAKPPKLGFEQDKKYINISWDGLDNVYRYELEIDGAISNVGQSTRYTHSGLDPNTIHTYRIRVVNQGGIGSWSNLYEVYTLPDPPQKPMNVQTEISQESIKLEWDASFRAEYYDVEVDGEIINNEERTIFVHEGLDADSEHRYRVRAVNKGGESDWTELLNITSLPYPPDVPSNIVVTKTKDHIRLNWDKSERASSYQIEVDGFIIDNEDKTFYLHEGLQPLSGHRYRIRSINRGGKSDWTEQLDITTHPEKPDTPVNVMATSDEKSISITWFSPPHSESYDIEIDGTIVTGIEDTIFKHSKLDADEQHEYRVRAVNVSGKSEWSSLIEISTLPDIEETDDTFALANVIAVVTNNNISLSWDAVAKNAQYEVEVDGDIEDNGDDTQYVHSNLNANSFHNYKIKVIREDGSESWCGVLALSTLPNIPNAPKNLTGIATSNSIELSWEKIDQAIGYDLELDGQIINIDDVSQVNYLHEELSSGTAHTYRLRAKNITGVTAWSSALLINTSNPMYMVKAPIGTDFDISLLANNVQDFAEVTFVVKYDPQQIELIDANRFTPFKDVKSGKIENTNLTIDVEFGIVKINVDKSLVPGTSWSGDITDIIFKSKTDEDIQIKVEVE